MILIPELETVLILTPRTGSGSLRRAIAERYPLAKLIYRHMEADGVPAGYDRWRRVGLVRNPLARLWSVYKFMRCYEAAPEYATWQETLRRSASREFNDWILNNETPFTSPYDRAHSGRYHAEFTVRHAMPENRKSQFVYLRPDLGTEILSFDDLDEIGRTFDVLLDRYNRTEPSPPPPLMRDADDYMRRVFKWDYDAVEGLDHGVQPSRRAA